MQIEYVAFIVACPVQFHRMNICEMEGIIVELLGIYFIWLETQKKKERESKMSETQQPKLEDV